MNEYIRSVSLSQNVYKTTDDNLLELIKKLTFLCHEQFPTLVIEVFINT